MGKKLKKSHGFTLIEVVISIAVISIISLGVYNAYLLLIRQTKAGQVRQTASLEGRRVSEEVKAAIENSDFNGIGTSTLSFGEMNFNNIGGIYERFLDENYNVVSEDSSEYTETITINKTETNNAGAVVELDSDQFIEEITTPSSVSYKIYIGKDENSDKDYITDDITGSNRKDLGLNLNKIILYVYFYENLNSEKSIIVKNFDGVSLLSTSNAIENITSSKVNLFINFSYYNPTKTSTLNDVEINVYNQTTVVPNIYMEKDSLINAYINPCTGEINVYNNRIDDSARARIGTLYDITVEIRDKDDVVLFTGNSKQNIK